MDFRVVGGVVAATAVAVLAGLPLAAVWWRRGRARRRRVLAEDALKHIHHCALRGQPATPDSLAGALRLRPRRAVELIARLESQGWLRSSAAGLSLTAEGVGLAVQVIRAHRLWERFLVDEARMPLADVHAEAERREHRQTAEELDALDAAMGHPAVDPHGDPIPTAGGELADLPGRPVTEWPIDVPVRIVHLEDEPPAVFAQIAAIGLRPGQTIRVAASGAGRIVLARGDERHVLAPIVAGNIFVGPVESTAGAERASRAPLASLMPGQQAVVHGLADSLQGFTRRRLLDLGITPGAAISAETRGVFKDPVAYRVRGSLIALRRDQAEQVWIDINGGGSVDHV